MAIAVITGCRLPTSPEAEMDRWIITEEWTEFSPSQETRILYISDSGNDDTGTYYQPDSPEVGSDPFLPAGPVNAFQTYAAAAEQVRNGYPDWILFERGGTHQAELVPVSGSSSLSPSLIGAYGSGELPILIPTDAGGGNKNPMISILARRGNNWRYAVITSLHFYSPDHAAASGNVRSLGLYLVAGGYGGEAGHINNILFEGCIFRSFEGNSLIALEDGDISNIIIRRCSILDNFTYTTDNGHSQGLFASRVNGFLLSENILDHNGWLNQSPSTPGEATVFNHNIYLEDCHNVEVDRNISIRPSSIHYKFTANSGYGSSTNIVVKDNLLIDGEVGIGIGGNTTTALRFRNVHVVDNVLTEMGRSQPTNRTLGWGIVVRDWDGGSVKDNYVLHNTNPNVTSTLGISLEGGSRNTSVSQNHVYGIRGISMQIDDIGTEYRRDNRVIGNTFCDIAGTEYVVNAESLDGAVITENLYYNASGYPFNLGGDWLTFLEWESLSNDESRFLRPDYADSTRSIERYNNEILGGSASIDDFIASCRDMNRDNWNDQISATEINAWLQAGFTY